MRTITISANDSGQRLDKFLVKAVPLLPGSLLYKYLRIKRIKCNGKRCDGACMLREGDVLELYINDSFFSEPEYPFLAAPADVCVVYENEHILIADKPQGLVVHEDNRGETDTLIHRIQHYLYDRNEYDPARENSFSPALCNRIDRNTRGLVMAAKSMAALQILSEKIRNREVAKLYICVVHGVPAQKSAILKGYHRKDAQNNTVEIRNSPFPGAKTALTKYRVLAAREGLALLEVELLTGRTHQIRAHLASVGHPLVGDTKYGRNRMNRGSGERYQALCSWKLRFDFHTDAGVINDLCGREFRVSSPPFFRDFGVEPPL